MLDLLGRLRGRRNCCLALPDAEERNHKNHHDQKHQEHKASAGFGPEVGARRHIKLDASLGIAKIAKIFNCQIEKTKPHH